MPTLPVQAKGTRPSRGLPYELQVNAKVGHGTIELTFVNSGKTGACIHVYDRKHLDQAPRRYTVEAGKRLRGEWDLGSDAGAYDLWVLGPNGLHRPFTGSAASDDAAEIRVAYDNDSGRVLVNLHNEARCHLSFVVKANAYRHDHAHETGSPGQEEHLSWSLEKSGYWYDFTVTVKELPGFSRRFAGRVETGRDSFSDPAMGRPARGDQEYG